MGRSARAALLCTCVALVACGASPDRPGSPGSTDGVTVVGASLERTASRASADDVRELTRAQLEFATDLYQAVRTEVDGDLALGPTSLHTLLAMVGAGARGRTATELADVLHLPLDERLHDSGNALDTLLRSRSNADGVELSIANRVWADDGITLVDDYVDVLAGSYGSPPATTDLSGDPENARASINAWVADNTGGMVEELFPEGSIDQSSRLVLANAVHFDALWTFPFERARTIDAPFTLADGTTVDVPTMQYDEYLPTGRGPGWSAVQLPYDGEQLSMTVVVPQDLEAFEDRLDADLLEQVDRSITDGGIHLQLPRFSADSHLSLADTLAAMGMPSAFGDGADFSGMTGAPDLALATVEHEAVLEVDELGTEAAAASGGVMRGSHGPTITVDRPFVFVVRDEETGAVLFLGRVTDPR